LYYKDDVGVDLYIFEVKEFKKNIFNDVKLTRDLQTQGHAYHCVIFHFVTKKLIEGLLQVILGLFQVISRLFQFIPGLLQVIQGYSILTFSSFVVQVQDQK
jgi:hypothetical protein